MTTKNERVRAGCKARSWRYKLPAWHLLLLKGGIVRQKLHLRMQCAGSGPIAVR